MIIEATQYHLGMRNPPRGVCFCNEAPQGGFAHIHTLEGIHSVINNDWVITGVKGERYPCKPDIFAATYDEVK